MALRYLSSIILFLQANIALPHEILLSLRASNRAFATNPQVDEDFWGCEEYCVDTNLHQWSEDVCAMECDLMTADQRHCIFTCKQVAHPEPKPWDDCNCECTRNCASTGPGAQASTVPTPLYTRPPLVDLPAAESADYDASE